MTTSSSSSSKVYLSLSQHCRLLDLVVSSTSPGGVAISPYALVTEEGIVHRAAQFVTLSANEDEAEAAPAAEPKLLVQPPNDPSVLFPVLSRLTSVKPLLSSSQASLSPLEMAASSLALKRWPFSVAVQQQIDSFNDSAAVVQPNQSPMMHEASDAATEIESCCSNSSTKKRRRDDEGVNDSAAPTSGCADPSAASSSPLVSIASSSSNAQRTAIHLLARSVMLLMDSKVSPFIAVHLVSNVLQSPLHTVLTFTIEPRMQRQQQQPSQEQEQPSFCRSSHIHFPAHKVVVMITRESDGSGMCRCVVMPSAASPNSTSTSTACVGGVTVDDDTLLSNDTVSSWWNELLVQPLMMSMQQRNSNSNTHHDVGGSGDASFAVSAAVSTKACIAFITRICVALRMCELLKPVLLKRAQAVAVDKKKKKPQGTEVSSVRTATTWSLDETSRRLKLSIPISASSSGGGGGGEEEVGGSILAVDRILSLSPLTPLSSIEQQRTRSPQQIGDDDELHWRVISSSLLVLASGSNAESLAEYFKVNG